MRLLIKTARSVARERRRKNEVQGEQRGEEGEWKRVGEIKDEQEKGETRGMNYGIVESVEEEESK